MIFFFQDFTPQVPAALAALNSKICLLAKILFFQAKNLQMSMGKKLGGCGSH